MTKSKIRILSINLVLLLAVVGAGYWGWSALHPAPAATVTATTTASVGDVQSTVSASGKVISPGDVGVSPSVAGTLTKVFVKVGDHVRTGQTLAKLDATQQTIALSQAKNSLANAQIALAKLTPSRTAAEQAQADLQLQQSKASVDLATANLATVQANQTSNAATYQTTVDNAKKALADAQALAPANAANYQTTVDNAKKALADAQVLATANAVTYQSSVDAAKASLDSAQINNDNYFNTWSPYGFTIAYCTNLNLYGAGNATIADSFSHCASILGNASSLANAKVAYNNSVLSQATNLKKDAQNLVSLQNSIDQASANRTTSLAKDAQNMASLQNAIDQAIANQTTNLAKDAVTNSTAITNAKNSLASATLSYNLFVAAQAVALQPAKQIDVDVAQTAIQIAQANYNLAAKNLAATTLTSPVTGDVASISSIAGENVGTASTSASSASGTATGFIVLTNVSSLRVQAGFSESDTAKIQAGQAVSYAYAALPTAQSTGKVSRIDLLPSNSTGATSYNVTFDLDAPVPGLKPGMSATVTVTTGEVLNTLQITAQAVTIRGTRATVNVLTTVAGKQVITPTRVVIGLQGDSSDQILSGVKAGAKIVLRTSSSSVGSNGFPTAGVPAVSGAGGTLGGIGGGGGGGGGGGRNGG